ncbi:MAG: peptidoglycan-associated lipoprotein Pal [Candidatus Eisenbacteria bacterium]|uniref:Peptidoglycan-associated lipoprotein n=1 Tax=Eiseniibacteriota bacterium TaxID=2212470 RepID=A0A948S061_UNCEI|nr:peptidoglycan-associated lipoprotein Pal [Candidatus Eisenbacteria bacterium]MBU1950306.1 peptidoglycan-associated lipoprotein Pal [Candidatus Eisenbacteria bacterium]MBU2692878.1 peptidoglycan-associated lipoprotein Pal [Candidatus Eisenbacteria bacterium]
MSKGVRILLICLAVSFLVAALGACSKKPGPSVDVTEGATEGTEEDTGQTIRPDSKPTSPDTDSALKMDDIFFDYDRYNLRSDAMTALERNAKLLSENPESRMILEGHCDERGTTEYNLALGEKRGQAALNFLTRYGIDPSRLTVISYGEERPFDPGHNESAYSKNRRVHFVIQ